MRGRKPKPTKLKISEGDARKVGVRKLRAKLASEPRPLRGFPDCPKHLKGLGRRAWEFLTEQIAAMEQDHRPDAIMLEGICVCYARAVQADKILAKEGLTFTEQKAIRTACENCAGAEPIPSCPTCCGLGYTEQFIPLKIRNRPEVAVSNAAWLRVRSFCSEFGLSPVSRTRLSIEKPDDLGADLATLLSKPREPKPVVN
jgi:P27 family predicted phage terminase small subunit